MKIGGNAKAVLYTSSSVKNAIGEDVKTEKEAMTINGFLDLISGDSRMTPYNIAAYNAVIKESSHIFISDYYDVPRNVSIAVIDDNRYEIAYVDDPMGLHEHLEIYLRYSE